MSEARHQRHVPHVFQGSGKEGKGNNNITKSVGKTHKLYTPGKRLIRQVTRQRKYYTGTNKTKNMFQHKNRGTFLFYFILYIFFRKTKIVQSSFCLVFSCGSLFPSILELSCGQQLIKGIIIADKL